MLFIPLLDRLLLPWWTKATETGPSSPRSSSSRWRPTALRRMGVGMLFAALSFLLSALVSRAVARSPEKVNIIYLSSKSSRWTALQSCLNFARHCLRSVFCHTVQWVRVCISNHFISMHLELQRRVCVSASSWIRDILILEAS